MLGLISPTAGSARILGQEPNREVLRPAGYVPQGLGLYADLSITENLDFRRRIFGGAATALPPEIAAVADRPVGLTSLGIQRRIAFTAALAHDPALLLLDEPTSGVGMLSRARLWDTVRETAESGAGALVTTHHFEEAEQCDRLVMLAAGKVAAAGSLDDVIAGRTVVEIGGVEPRLVLDVLADADLPASLSGRRVRVATGGEERVRRALAEAGVAAEVSERPASLQEAFVALTAS